MCAKLIFEKEITKRKETIAGGLFITAARGDDEASVTKLIRHKKIEIK